MADVLHFRDQIVMIIAEEVGIPIAAESHPERLDGLLCVPVIDAEEFRKEFNILKSEFPEIVEDLVAFLRREGATYEAGRRIVDYLLVVADRTAGNANHLIALRFRNPQERLAARAALYG